MGQEPSTQGTINQAPDGQELSAEVYSLLSQANLLRVRGQWDEAICKCTDAMRLAPDNISVQSLLGDIYENQGCIDDAIQWYRMALDRSPGSRADQMKLAHLLEVKGHLGEGTARHTVGDLLPPPGQALVDGQSRIPGLLRRADPVKTLRVATYVSACIVCAVVLLSVGVSHRTAGQAKDHLFQTDPVVLQSNTPPASSNSSAGTMLRDPSEQALLQALQTAPELASMGGSVLDVQSDPRSSHLTLTLVCQPPATEIANRATVLRWALRALQVTRDRTQTAALGSVTVRCLLGVTGTGPTPLIFTGDIARNDIPDRTIDIGTVAPDQLPLPFSNLWWAPAMPS